ncbi:TolC family protein [uncultured Eudoraea sp.]|uniref:TolC family protein n=1 Tax=uncultured Eudoraea sp. TaxID=1035614 RepID=UPI00260A6693|nr:TolC family protein [uncultured Eudoraea sp.]
MKHLSSYLIVLVSLGAFAQEPLTLNDCYNLVDTNYPLARQSELYEKQNAIDIEAIETDRLPELNLNAQATYQSEVIEIPLPDTGIVPPNKDQYRATLTVNQLIYGGGLINTSIEAETASLKTKQKQLEVNLYQLKKQVNQLYFSILLSQENRALLEAKREQLNAKLKEVQSGIKNGTILPASDKVLEVELLKINQGFIELDLNRASLLQTLASLIGKEITSTTLLQNPEITTDLNTELYRPELELFQLKKAQLETSDQLLSRQNLPKIYGFADGGYGNPGLNPLENAFQTFYVVGLKLNWNVFDWNATKKQRESLSINKDIIDTETNTFNLNTNIELQQQQSEIEKISGFIASDIEIIKLRKEVLNAADSQLRNGVITSSAYITELTNLYTDENTLITHRIQLELAKANYNIIQGQK